MAIFTEDGLDLELETGTPLLLEHEFIGSGGALAGESGYTNVIFIPPLAGGSLVGSIADVRGRFTVPAVGGAVGGGMTTQTFFDTVEVNGGVVLAPASFTFLGYIGQGGAATGGHVESLLRHAIVTSGGSLAGAAAALGIGHTGSGGAVSGGVPVFMARYNPEVIADLLKAAGSANSGFRFFEEGWGGAIVVGSESDISLKLSWRRLRGFRFKIGDVVYVPNLRDGYTQQTVRSTYGFHYHTIYEVGLGWYQDAAILSADEHLEWLRTGKLPFRRGRR